MSLWLTQLLDRGVEQSDWLTPMREQAQTQLRAKSLPNRQTEDYRYLPLAKLNRLQLAPANHSDFTPDPLPGVETLDLVFVNGKLITPVADLEPGLSVCPLQDADESMQGVFNQVKPERHFFGLVNDLLANGGVAIDVADNCVITKPIRLVHWQDGGEAHCRHLIRIGEHAALNVIEQHLGTDQASFNTHFCEYQLADHARLTHQRFAMQTGLAANFGGCHFNLANHSQLNSTVVGFGSDLARLDVDINHTGEHGHALQNAIYLLGEKELFDLHTNVEHRKPNGVTEQNVRGIVGDKGKAVFNGRIHIHRYAQKTLAELNNRNLLLTRNAEVYTKPELEIYADDVRCAHGATVAELDNKALYYLQSRGVSETDARVMLNFGFINELIEQIQLEPVAHWLQATLKDRFSSLRHQVAEA